MSSQFFTNAHGITLIDTTLQHIQGNLIQFNLKEADLSSLVYVKNNGYNTSKQCLANTRSDILSEIRSWARSPHEDVSPIFWLHGTAGSGKSAIAHTIAIEFDNDKQLGSFFPFDRTYLAECRHEKVFTTIARDLAHSNTAFKQAVLDVIQEKAWLNSTPDLSQQWDSLLVRPSVNLSNAGPILLVIDALDESGDHLSRNALLSILATRAGELPPNIRILLTSRTRDDILQTLSQSPHVLSRDLNDTPKSLIDHDISVYISKQLRGIDDAFFDSQQRLLVDRSEGLFQWAYVACEFIKDTGKISNPIKNFYKLLNPAAGVAGALDSLYDTVLHSMLHGDNDDAVQLFRSVMGQVLGLLEPLCLDDLTRIREKYPVGAGQASDIRLVMARMGPLLSGTIDHSIPIRPLHSSFQDYLTDRRRSKDCHVNMSLQRTNIVFATLGIMSAELRFNICNLESSYLLNSDVPDLAVRVEKCISSPLSYSCRNWGAHFRDTPFDSKVAIRVRQFLNQQFLYWLEALSLMKCIQVAASSLSLLWTWLSKNNAVQHRDVLDFVTDARRFVRMFGGTISQSTPHLYLSALPFSPQNSIVHQTYITEFPPSRGARVVSGRITTWPAYQSVLSGHTAAVNCAAFSPDGKYIVSGSDDNTVRVWHADTGNAFSAPFKQHLQAVTFVAFSPDGRRIISADKTILIWDANLGQADGALRALEGHASGVTSITFSPDGTQIASGSWDQTIRIWDYERGTVLADIYGYSHCVSNVVFSPDGKRIISASIDGTIRIWDIDTHELIADFTDRLNRQPVKTSMGITADGKRIISSFEGHTLLFRTVDTGKTTVWRPKTWIRNRRFTVAAFSAHLEYIVTGDIFNNTLNIWDGATGNAVAAPLEGHTNSVNSLVFSPDGQQILSSSSDKTARVWDMETLNQVANVIPRATRFKGSLSWFKSALLQNDAVAALTRGELRSVAFSRNNKNIILCLRLSPVEPPISRLDLDTGNAVNVFPQLRWFDNVKQYEAIAISPDGSRLISSLSDGKIYICDADTGIAVVPPLSAEGNTRSFHSATFSPGSSGMLLRQTLAGPLHLGGETDSIALSPDHKCIIYLRDKNIYRLGLTDRKEAAVQILLQGHRSPVCYLEFTPDGTRIISGAYNGTIVISDAVTGENVGEPLLGHVARITNIAFSPDGEHMASAADDYTICLWDLNTGRATMAPLRGHTDVFVSIAFSADGQDLVSSSRDKTARTWDVTVRPTLTVAPEINFSLKPCHALQNAGTLFQNPDDVGDWRDAVEVRQDGWIVGPQGRLILHVPTMHLPGIIRLRTKRFILVDATELDLSSFAHGPSWQACRSSGLRSAEN
ncbi:hypothetical protein HYPSUDRAFT_205985 [Hypholoma sublateritium FD-334 SS-4]|uniref:NACHT domain-containing protein n=1 Tax=Hypholoma sublateritium (strain FD-334 SS-4) TaxID=945553 RepID=A0A0D2PBF8_HYPSF|nr:hypothetical protein HYPSUDRAFT_205985 [Hypholoma sublateritium FD-334 SS-4]